MIQRRGWELGLVALAVLGACKGTEPPSALATITVTATDTDLDVGETVQATVVARAVGGAPTSVQGVTWTTSDSLVARVSATGAIDAEGPGSATITAASGSISGSITVRVVDRAHSLVFSSSVMPTALRGDTTLLKVIVRDSGLRVMSTRPVRWTSRNEAVATVSEAGVALGRAKGRTWIVARSGLTSDSVEMIVIAPRGGPNREVSFRHLAPNGAEEVRVWAGPGNLIERVSTAGRAVRSYRWSSDGEWMIVAYRPTPLLPASVELIEIGGGARLAYTPAGVQDADLSLPNSQLAMSVAVAGRQVIAVMDIDGTNLRHVTDDAGSAVAPLWAPDGRQIAFLKTPDPDALIGELWLMSPDGSSQVRVASLARNVAWSPDAKQLAFDDGDRVWLVKRDGSGLVAISPPPNPSLATENGRPRWSSDGRRLVHSYSGEVRVLASTGSILSTQTIDPSVKHPDFSPDGEFLIYATSNGLRIGPSGIGALRYTLPVNNVEPFPLWRP